MSPPALFDDIAQIAEMQNALKSLGARELYDADLRQSAYSERLGLAIPPAGSPEYREFDRCALESEQLRRDVVAASGRRRSS